MRHILRKNILFFTIATTIYAGIGACLLFSRALGQEPLAQWKDVSNPACVSLSGNEDLELTWKFTYLKKPSVLMQTANDTWKTSRGVAFDIRSDRSGPLFLRIDQNNKQIFLAQLNVSKTWSRKTLSFDDFSPYGKTRGSIEPSRVDNIYLVDLNGSDSGAKGERTVFIKQMALFNTLPSGKNSIRIPLLAFDSKGNILSGKQLALRGTSGGRWCYLSSPDDAAIPMQLTTQSLNIEGQTQPLPVVIVDKDRPATLEMLYWPAGKDYKIRLQANSRGSGIQSEIEKGYLLVNLALAKTRYRLLSEYLAADKGNLTKQLQDIGFKLAEIDREPSPRRQASLADALLLQMLDLSRDAVRSKARSLVDRALRPGKEVPVPTPQPRLLLPGKSVILSLEDPAFRIGMGQGFGFVTHKTPPAQIDHFYAQLRQAGFNMVTLPLYWDQVVDPRGKPTKWQQTLRFDTLAQLGFTFHAHGFVQSGMPEPIRKLKRAQFMVAAKQHSATLATQLAQRYGDRVVLWQAVNEPASNRFGGSTVAERINMVSELVGHMRDTLPGARVVVNDYDWERGLEAEQNLATRSIVGTLPFYRELLKSRHIPDVLAVEWYPGARVERPEFNVNLAEPCMDLLDTSLYWDRFLALGRPLIFTESNFPGDMHRKDMNGYAWGRWDSESQAQAAVDTLVLAMSKPGIEGWVWWSITDNEPWNRAGGLFTSAGKPKPVLEGLRTEIRAMTHPRTITVRTDGKLPMPTLPGIWKLSVKDGPTWRVKRDRSGKLSLVDL